MGKINKQIQKHFQDEQDFGEIYFDLLCKEKEAHKQRQDYFESYLGDELLAAAPVARLPYIFLCPGPNNIAELFGENSSVWFLEREYNNETEQFIRVINPESCSNQLIKTDENRVLKLILCSDDQKANLPSFFSELIMDEIYSLEPCLKPGEKLYFNDQDFWQVLPKINEKQSIYFEEEKKLLTEAWQNLLEAYFRLGTRNQSSYYEQFKKAFKTILFIGKENPKARKLSPLNLILIHWLCAEILQRSQNLFKKFELEVLNQHFQCFESFRIYLSKV